jgi:hypothetical protein
MAAEPLLRRILPILHRSPPLLGALKVQCQGPGQLARPAALEKLTDAIALAEPGGFVRAFVDLGLPMANLLNRLLKRRVAMEYIEALLAAFGTAEDPVLSAASAPPGASPAVTGGDSSSSSGASATGLMLL